LTSYDVCGKTIHARSFLQTIRRHVPMLQVQLLDTFCRADRQWPFHVFAVQWERSGQEAGCTAILKPTAEG
jgi:hypothetical protein